MKQLLLFGLLLTTSVNTNTAFAASTAQINSTPGAGLGGGAGDGTLPGPGLGGGAGDGT